MNSFETLALISVQHCLQSGETNLLLEYKRDLGELLKNKVSVSNLSCLPNDVDIIAKEVSEISNQFSHVIFIIEEVQFSFETYAGIAKAFSEQLVNNEYLKYSFAHNYPKNGFSDPPVSETSMIPRSSEIHDILDCHNNTLFPTVSIKNVHVFLRTATLNLQHIHIFLKSLLSSDSAKLFLKTENSQCVLEAAQKCIKQFEGKVQFLITRVEDQNNVHNLKVFVDVFSSIVLSEIVSYLRSLLTSNIIVSCSPLKSVQSLKQLKELLQVDPCRIPHLSESINIIRECFEKYQPENICLSFNGGKDCTALLHMTSCMLLENGITTQLKVFYVRGEDPFPEIEEFVHQCIKRYQLRVLSYSYPIKDALAELKAAHPEIEAILMGTRSTDPRAADLQRFHMTDNNWPQFMRVNPLLHWQYGDVWQFMRFLNVSYCCLYDHGYTSLGCRNNTSPNPKLRRFTPKGEEYFCPAYLLEEPNKEREGRSSSS